jgi:hypothetical protein
MFLKSVIFTSMSLAALLQPGIELLARPAQDGPQISVSLEPGTPSMSFCQVDDESFFAWLAFSAHYVNRSRQAIDLTIADPASATVQVSDDRRDLFRGRYEGVFGGDDVSPRNLRTINLNPAESATGAMTGFVLVRRVPQSAMEAVRPGRYAIRVLSDAWIAREPAGNRERRRLRLVSNPVWITIPSSPRLQDCERTQGPDGGR